MPSAVAPSARAVRGLRHLMPTGGGLPDQDWQGRHRLLTWIMVGSAGLLTIDGAFLARLALEHSWFWAIVHSVAVLLMAGTQIIAWRLAEVEEARARDDLGRAEAQFTAEHSRRGRANFVVHLDPRAGSTCTTGIGPARKRWVFQGGARTSSCSLTLEGGQTARPGSDRLGRGGSSQSGARTSSCSLTLEGGQRARPGSTRQVVTVEASVKPL